MCSHYLGKMAARWALIPTLMHGGGAPTGGVECVGARVLVPRAAAVLWGACAALQQLGARALAAAFSIYRVATRARGAMRAGWRASGRLQWCPCSMARACLPPPLPRPAQPPPNMSPAQHPPPARPLQGHQRAAPHLGGLLVTVRRQPGAAHRTEAAAGGSAVSVGVGFGASVRAMCGPFCGAPCSKHAALCAPCQLWSCS